MQNILAMNMVVCFDPVENVHHYSTIIYNSLANKKEYLRYWSLNFLMVVCDFGFRINLISLAIYKDFGLGIPKPTSMILLMIDPITKNLVWILCNVLVKIASIKFLVDFVILDYEVDFKVPIIFGMPYIKT